MKSQTPGRIQKLDPLYRPIEPLYNPYIISPMVLGDLIFRSFWGSGVSSGPPTKSIPHLPQGFIPSTVGCMPQWVCYRLDIWLIYMRNVHMMLDWSSIFRKEFHAPAIIVVIQDGKLSMLFQITRVEVVTNPKP